MEIVMHVKQKIITILSNVMQNHDYHYISKKRKNSAQNTTTTKSIIITIEIESLMDVCIKL